MPELGHPPSVRARRRAQAGVLAVGAVFGVSLAALMGGSTAQAATPECSSDSCTVTLRSSGGAEQTTWTVPAGATDITFTVKGADGGSATAAGGKGGSLTATPKDGALSAGDELALFVGGAGSSPSGTTAGSGGLGAGSGGKSDGSGSSPGAGGGSGSFIFLRSAGGWSPYLVAGGGGGGGGGTSATTGGTGGGGADLAGTDGAAASTARIGSPGSGAASATGAAGGGGQPNGQTGGAGYGTPTSSGAALDFSSSSLGVGGTGGANADGSTGAVGGGGGGGGGGCLGGGGGGGGGGPEADNPSDPGGWGGGGGGGGSAYADTDKLTAGTATSVPSGNDGVIVITYKLNETPPAAAAQAAAASVAPVITTQPHNQAPDWAPGAFVAEASGDPTPTVQWQYKSFDEGASWADIAGATSTTYPGADYGWYRAVFTNDAGSATTNEVYWGRVPHVTQQPTGIVIELGETYTLTTAATGIPTPTVQWQFKANAHDPWADITGATSTSHTTGTPGIYQAVFSNVVGSTATSTGYLGMRPTITQQPVGGSLPADGSGLRLTTTAVGGPDLTGEWFYQAFGPGEDFTETGVSADTPLVVTQPGRYVARFWSDAGTTDSDVVVVSAGPYVSTQPTGATITAGGSHTMTAAATGTPTPTMQWQFQSFEAGSSWVDIDAATSGSYTTSLPGNYRVVFTNLGASVTTDVAVVSVAPVVTTQPQGGTITSGGSLDLTAAASGQPAPTVQWQFRSFAAGATWGDVFGATAGTYAAPEPGTYRAVFTNVGGSVTTEEVAVTMAPVVTTQPVAGTITAGGSLDLTAAASGGPTPTVQWQFRSFDPGAAWGDVNGATSPTHSATQPGTYRAVFTNSAGSATTDEVDVSSTPAVTTQPVGGTLAPGGSLSLTAAASGEPAPSVQWQFQPYDPVARFARAAWSDISGATSGTYVATAPGSYRAVFTNSGGSVVSNVADVLMAPVITQQPVGATISAGGTYEMTANAGGGPTPTVQWQFSSTDPGAQWADIDGATSGSFTATQAGRYRAVFTNSEGSATTDEALLVVTSGSASPSGGSASPTGGGSPSATGGGSDAANSAGGSSAGGLAATGSAGSLVGVLTGLLLVAAGFAAVLRKHRAR